MPSSGSNCESYVVRLQVSMAPQLLSPCVVGLPRPSLFCVLLPLCSNPHGRLSAILSNFPASGHSGDWKMLFSWDFKLGTRVLGREIPVRSCGQPCFQTCGKIV